MELNWHDQEPSACICDLVLRAWDFRGSISDEKPSQYQSDLVGWEMSADYESFLKVSTLSRLLSGRGGSS